MRIPATDLAMTGRDDSAEGPLALRLHQVASPISDGADLPAGTAVVGFACDAGVVRNHGRPGAVKGPQAVRGELGGFAAHLTSPLYDAGDVLCLGDELEEVHAELGALLGSILDNGHRPLVIGGGHECAWGTYLGIRSHMLRAGKDMSDLAVVNIDAHFDLRHSSRPSSGTPFRQMADAAAAAGERFNYFCLGVAESANTDALFNEARELGTRFLTDIEMQTAPLALLDEVADKYRYIYLSVDLDALPAGAMPAVSAPATLGVPVGVLLDCVRRLTRSDKLIASEIAELNPEFDLDERGAKLAARVAFEMFGS